MARALPDPAEDAAAWERLRHREEVERKRRRTNALRLAWFALPALVVIGWAVWIFPHLDTPAHPATVCWLYSCQHFSATGYSAYLADATAQFFLLAIVLTALLVGLFFGRHPPFPVRFSG